MYEDEVDVASVLVRFENLTTTKLVRARDKKPIKKTLCGINPQRKEFIRRT